MIRQKILQYNCRDSQIEIALLKNTFRTPEILILCGKPSALKEYFQQCTAGFFNKMVLIEFIFRPETFQFEHEMDWICPYGGNGGNIENFFCGHGLGVMGQGPRVPLIRDSSRRLSFFNTICLCPSLTQAGNIRNFFQGLWLGVRCQGSSVPPHQGLFEASSITFTFPPHQLNLKYLAYYI